MKNNLEYNDIESMLNNLEGDLAFTIQNANVSESMYRVLILLLSEYEGHIHSYEDIYKNVWPNSVVSSNSLLLLIHNTRKILPKNLKIYNVRGRGYFISRS